MSQATTTVQVQAGESLSLLAKRHGTTVAALAKANGIHNLNLIRTGAVLRLPGDQLSISPAAQAEAAKAKLAKEAIKQPVAPKPVLVPKADPAPKAEGSTKAKAKPAAEEEDKEAPSAAELQAMLGRLERHGVTREWLEGLCEKHEVPVPLALALIWKESKGNPRAKSWAGAKGLMQLMPKTAAGLGVTNPYDAKQNLKAGVAYLGSLMTRFPHLNLALAAYNAGPTKVAKLGRVPQYTETLAYVEKIPAWMPLAGQVWAQNCP